MRRQKRGTTGVGETSLWMPVHVVVVLVSGFGGGDDGLEWRGLLSCSQQNKNNCENKLLSGEPNLTIMPHGDFS
jgi:hypothetical protein